MNGIPDESKVNHSLFRAMDHCRLVFMKLFLTLSATCLFSAVLGAQTCDVSTLNGAFGYTASGIVSDYRGTSNFNAAGRFVADGHGGLTVKDTISFFGQPTRGEFYSGKYTVNSDCTGTLTLNTFVVGVMTYDFVIVGDNELMFVSADSGRSISGSAKQQVVAPILT